MPYCPAISEQIEEICKNCNAEIKTQHSINFLPIEALSLSFSENEKCLKGGEDGGTKQSKDTFHQLFRTHQPTSVIIIAKRGGVGGGE